MSTPLRILMIEDDPFDCELFGYALKRNEIPHALWRVESAAELRAALELFKPQVIICDFSLPGFDGFEALEITGAACPEIPFFFSSGSIGKQRAQLAIKLGATGYALKGDFSGLLAQIKDHVRVEGLSA
jgi:CheY-like chemotaxis protein